MFLLTKRIVSLAVLMATGLVAFGFSQAKPGDGTASQRLSAGHDLPRSEHALYERLRFSQRIPAAGALERNSGGDVHHLESSAGHRPFEKTGSTGFSHQTEQHK